MPDQDPREGDPSQGKRADIASIVRRLALVGHVKSSAGKVDPSVVDAAADAFIGLAIDFADDSDSDLEPDEYRLKLDKINKIVRPLARAKETGTPFVDAANEQPPRMLLPHERVLAERLWALVAAAKTDEQRTLCLPAFIRLQLASEQLDSWGSALPQDLIEPPELQLLKREIAALEQKLRKAGAEIPANKISGSGDDLRRLFEYHPTPGPGPLPQARRQLDQFGQRNTFPELTTRGL